MGERVRDWLDEKLNFNRRVVISDGVLGWIASLVSA
jgi:hypothetical protein